MTGWHRHNGQPVPHLSGRDAVVTLLFPCGETEVAQCRIGKGYAGSWIWRKGYARVIRYKLIDPRGLATLRRIASAPRLVDNAGKETEEV